MTPSDFYNPDFDLGSLPAFPDLPARKNNIWLASYPKSGNTWMRLFLTSYLGGQDQTDINKDLVDNHQCNRRSLASLIARKKITDFSELDVSRVRVGMQRLYARFPQKLIIKTHGAIANFRGYPTFDAESTYKSIVVLRNPLAVLPSYAHHMGLDIDTAIISMARRNTILGETSNNRLPVFLGSWTDFTRSWIAARQMMSAILVKYEDMKADPEKAFGSVLSHIGMPSDPERMQRAIEATSFDKLKAQDIKTGFKERTKADKSVVFFRSGKVDGWRKELTEEQILATIHNHWDVMEQLDYIPPDLQTEFEDIKFKALEALIEKGTDIGAYADDLNALRAKRGIQSRLKVNTQKTQVSIKAARRAKDAKRPAAKRTFG